LNSTVTDCNSSNSSRMTSKSAFDGCVARNKESDAVAMAWYRSSKDKQRNCDSLMQVKVGQNVAPELRLDVGRRAEGDGQRGVDFGAPFIDGDRRVGQEREDGLEGRDEGGGGAVADGAGVVEVLGNIGDGPVEGGAALLEVLERRGERGERGLRDVAGDCEPGGPNGGEACVDVAVELGERAAGECLRTVGGGERDGRRGRAHGRGRESARESEATTGDIGGTRACAEGGKNGIGGGVGDLVV
jgi:hypothetical protein